MSAGDTSAGGVVNITLKNGSSSGDTRLVLPTSHSGFAGAGGKYFGNAPFLDMQSRGILFEDGIYLRQMLAYTLHPFSLRAGRTTPHEPECQLCYGHHE